MTNAAQELIETARTLTVSERDAIAAWRRGALTSERSLALNALWDRARDAGRYSEVIQVMDSAFRAALDSAGVPAYSYFAEDRGDPPAWDDAGRLAAEAAAATLAADLISAPMRHLLLEPWLDLTARSSDTRRP